jgi:hypothetical protein
VKKPGHAGQAKKHYTQPKVKLNTGSVLGIHVDQELISVAQAHGHGVPDVGNIWKNCLDFFGP